MNYTKLSKDVSYALRHAPWEYELELDDRGWVEIDQLLASFRECDEWICLQESDIYSMIEKSDKKRHEILNNKIRAIYGHSIPLKIIRVPQEPPLVLYHGTARRFLAEIQGKGLLPQNRQYVHLSIDKDTAFQVGKRRDTNPTILSVNSHLAWIEGYKFYNCDDKVWLADSVPNKYINDI